MLKCILVSRSIDMIFLHLSKFICNSYSIKYFRKPKLFQWLKSKHNDVIPSLLWIISYALSNLMLYLYPVPVFTFLVQSKQNWHSLLIFCFIFEYENTHFSSLWSFACTVFLWHCLNKYVFLSKSLISTSHFSFKILWVKRFIDSDQLLQLCQIKYELVIQNIKKLLKVRRRSWITSTKLWLQKVMILQNISVINGP